MEGIEPTKRNFSYITNRATVELSDRKIGTKTDYAFTKGLIKVLQDVAIEARGIGQTAEYLKESYLWHSIVENVFNESMNQADINPDIAAGLDAIAETIQGYTSGNDKAIYTAKDTSKKILWACIDYNDALSISNRRMLSA